MSNSTQVYVDKKVVAKTCKQIIDYVLQERAKIKEATIKELMEPYRYWFFWKKQRTREEAETYLHNLIVNWESSYHWSEHLYFYDSFIIASQNLLKAAIINEGDIMLLSLTDAILIENWRDKE